MLLQVDRLGRAPPGTLGDRHAPGLHRNHHLVNALAVIDRDMVLVLDDDHLISAPTVHAAVAFLLEHLPNRDCLAIGSRADPPLPLARLRAHEQLVELRAADLRFTPDERPKTKDEKAFDSLERVSSINHPVSSFVLRPSSDSYSRLILEEIDHANLFVLPLDDEQCWYRYHHLFRAFLRARLDHEPPSAIAHLHRRASAWYEQHQLLPSAVEHALAAGDLARAADLIEASATTIVGRGEYATLHSWLEHIPEAILAARPALCLWAAWAALLAGEVERIAPLFLHAESAWQAPGDQRRLGELAHLQAHLARLRHDPDQTIAAAEHALVNLAEEQAGVAVYLPAGYIALARTQLARGDGTAATLALDRALQAARRMESPAYARWVRAEQARLAFAQGDLVAAQRWQAEVAPELAGQPDAARTVEALMLARVLIAQGRSEPRGPALHAAHTILARLRQQAAAHKRTGSLIEILALIALATAAAGCRDQARASLQQALVLAQPEGYARIFLDEGAPMRSHARLG